MTDHRTLWNCASDDELKRLLWPHRQERERAGSLTIR